MNRLKAESGYTLIESIGFIAVISMLAISIISLINNMLDKYRMSRVTQQIVELQKNIDFRFASSQNFKDLKVKQMVKEKIVPGDMADGENLYHAYHGDVELKAVQQNSAYTITFKGLPYVPCLELAMVDWMTGYNSHLMHIKVNSKYFTWQGKSESALPMDFANAQKACKHNQENVITWQFQ